MSIYNSTGLGFGCNGTTLVQNNTVCSQIGGTWQPGQIWCSAQSLEQVKAMETKALNENVIVLCKESSASSIRKKHKPFLWCITILSSVVLIGFLPIAQGAPNGSSITIQPQAQPCQTRVERVGDGNPHPSCRWKQVTGNIQCGGGSCAATHLETRTLSYGFGGTAGKFGTGGFDVTESYTTGNSYTCSGTAGQTVCVTALVEYTDYTVEENIYGGNCAGGKYHTPYVIYAPNKSGQQKYRCHHNENCHGLDWERWNHDAKTCDQS